MKSTLLVIALTLVTLPAFAQVPPTKRIMVCNKVLWVFTTSCRYVNKPIKPAVKKPRVRVDITKPGNYNNMSAEERAIINAR